MSLIGYLSPFLQSFDEARAALTPVIRLIDEAETSETLSRITNPPSLEGDIRFHRVTFAYPSRADATVLNDLSFVARAGQTTAIVGSSGSGK